MPKTSKTGRDERARRAVGDGGRLHRPCTQSTRNCGLSPPAAAWTRVIGLRRLPDAISSTRFWEIRSCGRLPIKRAVHMHERPLIRGRSFLELLRLLWLPFLPTFILTDLQFAQLWSPRLLRIMDAYQARFMIPPDFSFPPNGRIKPGIVLKEGNNGFPDPRTQLHDATASVLDTEERSYPEFRYSGEAQCDKRVGFWIDVLSVVEIGLGGERGLNYNLAIETGPAQSVTFEPSKTYISQMMSDPFLSEYTKRPRRAPIYLITGVMTAENATIELQKGQRSAFQAKIVVDAEGFGAPVKIGPEFEREASHIGGPTWKETQPFVLAYTLKRIRRKIFGGVDATDHNNHALWGDGKDRRDEDWDVEDFVQSFVKEDNELAPMQTSQGAQTE